MFARQRPHADENDTRWPYAAMLGFGYFGAGTPEGRSHRTRSMIALAVFLLAYVGATITTLPWALRVACGVMVPLSWVAILWSTIRYVSTLDELTRLIQLEATALAYGVVLVVGSIWFALGALRVLEGIQVAPTFDERKMRSLLAVAIPTTMLVVEVLRGAFLVMLARRRR